MRPGGALPVKWGWSLRSLPYAFLAASTILPSLATGCRKCRYSNGSSGARKTQRAGLAFTPARRPAFAPVNSPSAHFKPIIKAIEKGRAGPAFHLTEEGGAVTAIKGDFSRRALNFRLGALGVAPRAWIFLRSWGRMKQKRGGQELRAFCRAGPLGCLLTWLAGIWGGGEWTRRE